MLCGLPRPDPGGGGKDTLPTPGPYHGPGPRVNLNPGLSVGPIGAIAGYSDFGPGPVDGGLTR